MMCTQQMDRTRGSLLAVIPAQAGIQFLLLDSGSRPTALPGMTGCPECPARVEDFVQGFISQELLQSPRLVLRVAGNARRSTAPAAHSRH